MSRAEDGDLKVRFLRALAFEIRRKVPAADAMTECIEREGQRGRHHRVLRPAIAVLEADGFIAALRTLGFVGGEAAAVLTALAGAADHRLLAASIGALADFHEQGGAE